MYLGAGFDASTTNLTYLIPPPADCPQSAKIVLSFSTPITPTSTFRQSLPATYITVYIDGAFDVVLYADVNGEWLSGSRETRITWDFDGAGTSSPEAREAPIKTWKVSREAEQVLSEINDRGEWGTFYFTGPAGVHHQAGASDDLRRSFAETGNLTGEIDKKFRGIMDQEPAFAFSYPFRHSKSSDTTASTSSHSITFTLAFVQEPVAQFASARGLTLMRPLWASYLADADAMIQWHYHDFGVANELARNYSNQLASDAFASGSREYQDIVALSARQVLGATQFAGTPDSPILFLKEISSNGNFQTVDVIFPAMPFFLYTNPKWLGYLLEPLIEHMMSGQYPNNYSMHDLGTHFPNATGHRDGNDEYMPVEECGDMLIMGLALANALRYDTKPQLQRNVERLATYMQSKAADDKTHGWSLEPDVDGIDTNKSPHVSGERNARNWLSRSYGLLKQWTGYLVRESLIPAHQLCTDDFAGRLANQTNLALKGIIGIKAMAEIASFLGHDDDARYYANVADEYIDKWQELGISRDSTHAKLAYTWYGSWTTLYNLYADSLLCFRVPNTRRPSLAGKMLRGWQSVMGDITAHKPAFVPDRVYQMQSNWYHAVLQRYGLPLDSRHLYAKSDWEFFAAAITSRKTRAELVRSIASWVNETTTGKSVSLSNDMSNLIDEVVLVEMNFIAKKETDRPFTDLYETEGSGGWPGPHFKARPVVGGHFAMLALERACGGRAMERLGFLDDPEAFESVDSDHVLEMEYTEGKLRSTQTGDAQGQYNKLFPDDL